MLELNKTNSKPFLLAFLLIILFFSAAEKTNAFPDFDYDGQADFSVFRPSDNTWYAFSSESQTYLSLQWGLASDVLVPADYDGDSLTDFAVWRPSNGVWYVHRSSDNRLFAIQWGGGTTEAQPGTISLANPDVPAPADFDGDGMADFAVWRPDSGVWYVLQSSDGYATGSAKTYQFGKLGDIPVQADYDGDKKADIAVFRSSENRWYILQSSNNQLVSIVFGQSGDDLLVPSDYDGDGKTDVAVYRDGVWNIRRSIDGQVEVQQFGMRGDKPVPADYDGDRKTDLAVYRNGTWYVSESSTKNLKTFYYGLSSDIPLASLRAKESLVAVH